MNILYDHQIFVSQRYGGISRYFYEIASRIAEWEKVYLFEGFYINKYGLEQVEKVNVVNALKNPQIPKIGRLLKWLNTLQLRWEFKKRKYDIYHPTYYGDYNTGNGKLVLTVHDMIYELFPKYFVDAKKIVEEKRNIINKANRIIAISNATKNDLVSILKIPVEKIDVVYHGNSLNLSVTENRLIKEPYFLYVGARGGYKNFNRMLEAFAFSNYRNELACVAFGGGEFNDEEYRLINRLKLQNRVVQISGDDKKLANLYKYAEAFVYPSEYEGFGLPLLEAMHYGTPVLTSNTSSLPEVAEDAAAYFVPQEIDDIRRAMETVFDDKQLRNVLVEKGLAREKQFSWEKCAEATLAVYRNALE